MQMITSIEQLASVRGAKELRNYNAAEVQAKGGPVCVSYTAQQRLYFNAVLKLIISVAAAATELFNLIGKSRWFFSSCRI